MSNSTSSLNKKHKVLIANRGEIAVRIIRACHELDYQTVAIYADQDIDALHVQMADEAYGLQGTSTTETYLSITKIVQIAKQSGATLVHPGYGFLSENAEFARAIEDAGLIWVGPEAETIELLGNKVSARQLALSVGAPLAKGTSEPVKNAQEALAFAQEYGLPIAIKAAFGGGGRGLKIAYELADVKSLYESAVREAEVAFGRGECFIEQFLAKPRHIEVQILGDGHGKVLVLGSRDCSLQRRNQKLVEEAPAPFLSEALQSQLFKAAHDITAAANYRSAGTVEFLLSANGELSFLEVNTRLQVEHPVTEATSGVDIVLEQLKLASGQDLSFTETPRPHGHAFEFRINAEDPANGFLPTPGTITRFDVPGGLGIRLDSGVHAGSQVVAQFDSLMAKLIVWGQTRQQALARARQALQEFKIEGVASVLPFHQAVLNEPAFCKDFAVHTKWIEEELQAEFTPAPRSLSSAQSLLHTVMEIDGKRHEIALPSVLINSLQAHTSHTSAPQSEEIDDSAVQASIAGTLLKWVLEDGAEVHAGQTVAILEAMKMEVEVKAHTSGKLKHQVQKGSFIDAQATIATIA
ncbi:acetyl/propionyl/methylcrotonyl-CoA carboxylase subunit alpha [Brackiella oedipodis]|uniref:acetyl/propionyl/methylcrotonyl-CoA carboxylase subunit alpha n=1 Tax=Brackiella oedipodis TaxID=124225 RepID=UPI00048EAF76|nr:biotin carboxylase N-terminal domain-containing protein [Brackiella oedipodis]